MMTAAEIRQSFFDFFERKQHEIVPSSPIVLPADPTLLFTNAGMNQFKEIFLGARTSEASRVADTQKCIRVSGKHNDLEEVGIDTYHHTFFEMLGNWSFGDYYKREVIGWAWELLTEVWKLPKDRLWATVYTDDDEAAELWAEVTDIGADHILRFGEKDNFWEMGETGPCGPCSEIHIDLTEDGSGKELVNAGSPEVIEIWNLVFIQYNRKADKSLEELPRKHVDTGMGLERVVAVIQGKKSNYDTDLFQPLIQKIEAMSGRRYEGEDAIAMRVVADHLRTLSFAIGDGVLPSNDGRGYVLRRLLRRAVRYGRKLGMTEPFMGRLFPVLQEMMGELFPELRKQEENILRALESEESSFAAALDRGMELFDGVAAAAKAAGEQIFPGDEAFKLYDTYGFPIDLTELMAGEQGLTLDLDRCEVLMAEQKQRARAARNTGALNAEMDQIAELVNQGVSSEFSGYTTMVDEGKILAVYVDGNAVEQAGTGVDAQVLLSRTPFYAESGGQVGDVGVIESDAGRIQVADTRKPAAGLILHQGTVSEGVLAVGDVVRTNVSRDRRMQLQRHHTATHILNFALRQLVNENIKQAGSYVAPDRLRFDFNHYEALTGEQLRAIEKLVNEKIMEDDAVSTYEMELKEVHKTDIVAVFDEKYGDKVRVVNVGGFSKELCGGTHVERAGQIGLCRIVSESSVAAGIRRIEAVCGWSALEWTEREHDLVQQMSQRFSINWPELPKRVESLVERNRELEKELKEQAQKAAQSGVGKLIDKQVMVNGVAVLAADAGEMAMENLRGVLDTLMQQLPDGVIVLGAANGGKACFAAAVGEAQVAKGLHAGKLIGQVAKLAGGGGGGRANKAQAGAKDGAKVGEAIAAVPEILSGMIKE